MNLFTRIWKLHAMLVLVMTFVSFNMEAKTIKLNENSNNCLITNNSGQGFTISYYFSEFKTMDVKTQKGTFARLLVSAYAHRGEFGSPEIPVKSDLIEIPVGATVNVRVINDNVREYSLKDLGIDFPLMPCQPPVPKTGQVVDLVYNKDAYKTNAFGPEDIATVTYLGTMRGVNIGRLDIAPVQYNPVTRKVRVHEAMEIEVTFKNADLQTTEYNKQLYGNPYFSTFYNSLLNYMEPGNSSRENFSRYPIKYVIVADPMFEDQLQPFIQWKIKKGFTVVEAYTDQPEVGTTTGTIKTYLQNLYENATPDDPAPTFVLFVGDIAQIPAWTGQAASHVTDLYYCEYTGDYFPEVFYGRFSAQNVDQLQPQIDKTLMMEQYTMPDPAYLDTVVMIAGMDGTFGPIHGNGQINYGTENYFNESNGIYSHTYLYPESGNSAAIIRQNISDGVSYANYTAHGSPSGWADPSFSVGDIPNLQNDGKYGLLIGNCCSTSEYQVNECFGEALLRAANKGAAGYIGASNSTYWDEDYYFGIGVGEIAGDPPSYEETTLGNYDRAFHTHGELFPEWYTTMDQMVFAGNLAVTEGSPGSALYYWEAYCLMGDPSLMPYLWEPSVMTITFDPVLPLGNPTMTVNAVPYAYVALSMNGEGLGAALADSNGVAVVELVTTPSPGNADLVVTAQNYQPYMGTVLIANPQGPYVVLNEYAINDSNGNGNGMVDNGEDILLDSELKNWGSADAVNITTNLSTDDEYITISDNEQDFGTIAAEDSVMQSGAYHFLVADSIPDMRAVDFYLDIQDEETRELWNSTFTITLHAPVIQISEISVVDTAGGNGNYRLDPGETVDLVVDCENTGHCHAFDALATLLSASPELITIENAECTFDTLNCGGMKQAVFHATVADEIDPGTLVELHAGLTAGPYSNYGDYYLPVGLIMEDFETGDFTAFDWVMGGTQPWQITDQDVYEGTFSARSGAISDLQTSEMSIDMNVAVDDSISFYRKVSCEDDPYNDNYDWLGFFVDDVRIDHWDGEVAWGRVAYPVTAGEHTFKWEYYKDYSATGGQDAAWVDNIIFPAMAAVVGVNDLPAKGISGLTILPNPAGERTMLNINLKEPSAVSVSVYDLTGNKVKEVLDGKAMGAGMNQVRLDVSDLSAGLYICVLKTNEKQFTKKLIINK